MKLKDLKKTLKDHKKWLSGNTTGKRAILIGADLEGASLELANLELASLRGANLEGAKLELANLVRASLIGASLERVNLAGANLERANLIGANLMGANLEGAKLERVNLAGANLAESRGLKYAQCAFTAHGDHGRLLTLAEINGELIFFCGCFVGSPDELREYIDQDDDESITLKESRTLAMEFCLAAIKLQQNG